MGFNSVLFRAEKFNEFKCLEDVSLIHEGDKRHPRIFLDTTSKA
jgi:hypothetical protein